LGWRYGHEGEGRRRRRIEANLLSALDDGLEFGAVVEGEGFGMQQELVAAKSLAGVVDGHHAGGIPEPQGVVV
jgi:hypothetical protein